MLVTRMRTFIDTNLANDPDCIKGRKKTVQVKISRIASVSAFSENVECTMELNVWGWKVFFVERLSCD